MHAHFAGEFAMKQFETMDDTFYLWNRGMQSA